MKKTYLGDGVFVEFIADVLVLTTEDGIRETNRIVLEPSVYSDLVRFVERITTTPKEHK